MENYKMQIIMTLIEENPELKKAGINDVIVLVNKVLKAQKIVDEKIRKSKH